MLFSNAQSPQAVPVAKLFAQLEEIGVKTGAFVQPPKSYSDRVSENEQLSFEDGEERLTCPLSAPAHMGEQ